MNMRIAIVGSRDFADLEKMEQVVLRSMDVQNIAQVASGASKGADTLAKLFAAKYNIPFLEISPDVPKHGVQAHQISTSAIIDNSDIVFVFSASDCDSSQEMVSKAKSREKIVVAYRATDDKTIKHLSNAQKWYDKNSNTK
jgi:hypothetical protein